MTRRRFLGALLGAFPMAAIAWLLARCGSTSSDGASCETGGVSPTYLNVTHTHSLVFLTKTTLDTGAAGNYRVLAGDHEHTVALTGADFTTISGGGTVTATTDTHGHQVRLQKC